MWSKSEVVWSFSPVACDGGLLLDWLLGGAKVCNWLFDTFGQKRCHSVALGLYIRHVGNSVVFGWAESLGEGFSSKKALSIFIAGVTEFTTRKSDS